MKASSYQAKDIDLKVLPLSQIYVFREEMSKQYFWKQEAKKHSSNNLRHPHHHQSPGLVLSHHKSGTTSLSPQAGGPRDFDIDYEMVDQVLQKLIFFKSFGRQTRQKLYKEFQYDFVYQKQSIFAQKDPNEQQQLDNDSCI